MKFAVLLSCATLRWRENFGATSADPVLAKCFRRSRRRYHVRGTSEMRHHLSWDDGSKDAGDYRKEGTEEKEEGTDLFYKRPESFLSAITASFTAFSTVSFTNSNSNPPP
jgi:hypothetical protein